jgi:hypothetical protein
MDSNGFNGSAEDDEVPLTFVPLHRGLTGREGTVLRTSIQPTLNLRLPLFLLLLLPLRLLLLLRTSA